MYVCIMYIVSINSCISFLFICCCSHVRVLAKTTSNSLYQKHMYIVTILCMYIEYVYYNILHTNRASCTTYVRHYSLCNSCSI